MNGGISASDEACPNYEEIINNMMAGHEFLKREFDVVPRVAFMLDSFGHSSANARLFAEMGIEAIFSSRATQSDKIKRMKRKSMTYLWRPFSTHFGDQHQILM